MLRRNLFTQLCQITYPLIQAPMSPVTSPELVATVSNAGGLGSIAGARMTGEQLEKEIARVRSLTTNTFAVNLFISPDEHEFNRFLPLIESTRKELKNLLHSKRWSNFPIDIDAIVVQPPKNLYPEQIEVIFEQRIPLLSFTFGCVSDKIIERCKQLGILLMGTATTPHEAIYLQQKGCDAICLQGSEAGGHRGSFLTNDDETIEKSTIGLLSLLSQTKQFIDADSYPLVVAGGIMNGHDLANVLMSGASAVQMGTRFLTCDESKTLVPKHHQDLLLNAKNGIDRLRKTVLTRAYTGKPARGIQTAITDHFSNFNKQIIPVLPWQIQSQLVLPISQEAAKIGHTDFMQLWAGQNYTYCSSQPATTIVHQVIREAREIADHQLIIG